MDVLTIPISVLQGLRPESQGSRLKTGGQNCVELSSYSLINIPNDKSNYFLKAKWGPFISNLNFFLSFAFNNGE